MRSGRRVQRRRKRSLAHNLALIVLVVAAGCSRAPAAQVGVGNSREDLWKNDIAYMANELKAQHKDLFFQVTQDTFNASVQDLSDRVPLLTDEEIMVEMAGIVASVGDGHTSLSLQQSATGFGQYPIQLYQFSDGLYIIGAASYCTDLLGAEVVRIGSHTADEALAAVAGVISHENDARLLTWAPAYLTVPEVLAGCRIVEDPQQAQWYILAPDGSERIVGLAPVQRSAKIEWTTLPDARGIPTPLYQEQSDAYYWCHYFDDEQTMYLRYDVCDNMAEGSFAEFTRQMLEVMDEEPTKRLVVDLRRNGGGNSQVIKPLLSRLKRDRRFRKDGSLYVLIGRRTFSSAVINALALRRDLGAIIVGEPSGGKPNHYGELGRMALPNSGLVVSYSTKYIRQVKGDPLSIMPDVPVDVTFSDYSQGRDAALQTILDTDLP